MKHLNRAVFLDRDGVINVDKGYVHRIEDFEFLPGAPEAIRLLKEAGYLVIVVTNQSGVARGFYTHDAVSRLHLHMDDELARRGTGVDAYYVCPHHPVHGVDGYLVDCLCRKPLPGMLQSAAEDLSIDLSRSFMIGDKMTDVEAGLSAGCVSLLVGMKDGESGQAARQRGVAVCADLMEAARAIIMRG